MAPLSWVPGSQAGLGPSPDWREDEDEVYAEMEGMENKDTRVLEMEPSATAQPVAV